MRHGRTILACGCGCLVRFYLFSALSCTFRQAAGDHKAPTWNIWAKRGIRVWWLRFSYTTMFNGSRKNGKIWNWPKSLSMSKLYVFFAYGLVSAWDACTPQIHCHWICFDSTPCKRQCVKLEFSAFGHFIIGRNTPSTKGRQLSLQKLPTLFDFLFHMELGGSNLRFKVQCKNCTSGLNLDAFLV